MIWISHHTIHYVQARGPTRGLIKERYRSLLQVTAGSPAALSINWLHAVFRFKSQLIELTYQKSAYYTIVWTWSIDCACISYSARLNIVQVWKHYLCEKWQNTTETIHGNLNKSGQWFTNATWPNVTTISESCVETHSWSNLWNIRL